VEIPAMRRWTRTIRGELGVEFTGVIH
jgi:hypothetical protein